MSDPFASRAPAAGRPNRLSRALARRRRQGRPVLDLTLSDPTGAGLHPGRALLAPLADPAGRHYRPEPLGPEPVRRALAADLGRRRPGPARPRPEDLVLAASTSEAYGWLFKLLCEPGDRVLVPAPGYPLCEQLAALEGVTAAPYPLDLQDRWRLDVPELARRVDGRTRAVVVISPHNPTGWTLSRDEAVDLLRLAREHDLTLIGDEVFADYVFVGEGGWRQPARAGDRPAPSLAALSGPVRRVSLGGLSKEAGLPQMKVAWLRLGGGAAWRRQARERLEVVADAYLSVATPQQHALPAWLAAGEARRERIRRRIRRNRRALGRVTGTGRAELLPSDGGWAAALRLPAVRSDEEDALALLREEGVLVHPGYLFDFPPGTWLVLSLLPRPADFDAGCRRLAAYLERRLVPASPGARTTRRPGCR